MMISYREKMFVLIIAMVAIPTLLIVTSNLVGNDSERKENIAVSGEPTSCHTDGGTADATGLKVWCWQDIDLPDYQDRTSRSFSDGELHIDSECYEKQVSRVGNQLQFRIDPMEPKVSDWCPRDFNMRAEIRTSPWNIRHALGTEEWFGWSYTFGTDYVVDRNNQWLFFQVHPGIMGESPQVEFTIVKEGQVAGHKAGEIFIVNAANRKEYWPTGIVPGAGETLDLVVHVVWGDASQGLLQVWIDGKRIYDKQVPTVYQRYPWGGNAKWGIYKWPWTQEAGVRKSKQQGITRLETFMGPLRIITRNPDDQEYLEDAYTRVVPR